MIACISPADRNYDETLSTLRYACRAKNISNIPTINEDPKDAQLRQYQEEILNLKRMLDENQQHESVILHKFVEDNNNQCQLWLEAEKVKMRQQMLAEISDIKGTPGKANLKSKLPNSDQSENGDFQLNARKRIDLIKHALIGGERVHDLQLQERHRMRKMEAKRHLSAIAHALSRVEIDDRDLLQGHYASIQQEINIKNERIKMCSQKIKMLEREVADLNSEFQLDREDYLDEIRHLGRNLKFYQLLIYKAQPILRKNGRNWNPEQILENSLWNDDLKTWKLPNDIENNLKLPPAIIRADFHGTNGRDSKDLENHLETHNRLGSSKPEDTALISEETPETYKINILKNYFRSNRKMNDQWLQRTKSSQVYNRDFKLRKNTSLPINELQSPFIQKNKTLRHDFSSANMPKEKP